MTIKLSEQETGERILVVYEPANKISFFRTLHGVETTWGDDYILSRTKQQIKKWRN